MKRWLAVWCALAAAGLAAARPAAAGRYESFTAKAAEGPKMRVVAATYFGADGLEEFVAADALPDGTIVAFGNAWGPTFPTLPAPLVLGKGQHRGLSPYEVGRGGERKPSASDPDAAGMIVFYDRALGRILRVLRFDWGVASISTGMVSADGKSLIVAGRATDAFRGLASSAGLFKTHPAPGETAPPDPKARRPRGPAFGPYTYEGVTRSGDVYVLSLSATTGRIEWVWVLEGHRDVPDQLWKDRSGAVYFQVHGVTRIAAGGQALTKLTDKGSGGQVGLRAVDPKDGSFFIGGDRNTSTGREPWRQPFFYRHDPKGTKVWTLWEWPSRNLRDGKGSDDGLVSDSACRAAAIAANGDIIIGGWSDGGNSIFTRQPTDIERPVPKGAFGMSCWGMKSANSLAYLMRVDPKSLDVKTWCLWVAYVPDSFTDAKYRGAPNFANIQQVVVLGDGSVGFHGATATALVQTPNAFQKYPGDGRKYGGEYVAVFDEPMANLLFSSHLPGCENVAIAAVPGGMVAVSRSRGDDGQQDPTTPSPTVNAIQKTRKGEYDAHIVLLESPGAAGAATSAPRAP